jgi:hypothetical protein
VKALALSDDRLLRDEADPVVTLVGLKPIGGPEVVGGGRVDIEKPPDET